MQEHLYRHFSSPGHRGFLNDVSVTLIDKMDGSDPKKREGLKNHGTVWFKYRGQCLVLPMCLVSVNVLLCESKLLEFNFRHYD